MLMLKDWTSPHPYPREPLAGTTIRICFCSLVLLTEKIFQQVEKTQKVVRQEGGDERRKRSLYLFWDTGWSCEPFLPTLPLAVGAHESSIVMSTQERNRITSGLESGTDKILVQAGESAGVTPLSQKCKLLSIIFISDKKTAHIFRIS